MRFAYINNNIPLPNYISNIEEKKLEERFIDILNEVAVSDNIILFIDDIHNLAGVSSEGTEGVDLSEVLAAEVRKHNIIVIGATNSKEFVQYIEGKALGQALQKILLESLNFASRFEYGPVQRTLIEIAMKKARAFSSL